MSTSSAIPIELDLALVLFRGKDQFWDLDGTLRSLALAHFFYLNPFLFSSYYISYFFL